jgi:hypothetical protein
MTREPKVPGTDPASDVASEDGFLSRWSRRKREIADELATPQPASAPVAIQGAVATKEAHEPPADPDQVAATAAREKQELDELIARLPPVESIAKDTDVTGFLDARIPDVLRNAALRAAWSADPAIRDFLNDAREYALDYNTPGAAYGYGPLTESDLDLKAMVHQIFGDAPKVEKPEGEAEDTAQDVENREDVPQSLISSTDASCEISDTESQPVIAASQHTVALESVRRSEPALNLSKLQQKQSDMSSDSFAALRHDQHDVTLTNSNISGFQRRGGRATPA